MKVKSVLVPDQSLLGTRFRTIETGFELEPEPLLENMSGSWSGVVSPRLHPKSNYYGLWSAFSLF